MSEHSPRSWILDLLGLFAGEAKDDLLWFVDPHGEVHFEIDCSDIYAWASADSEAITAADLPHLLQAKLDAHHLAADDRGRWPILWVSRKRQRRPMNAYYALITPPLAALLNACGPERDPEDS